MHVKAKQMAFLGLLLAFVSILIILASVIESNTLFLLAAGAFMIGIAIREYGLIIGFSFHVACILLGILLSPNKLYVLTFAGLSLYILWEEVSFVIVEKYVSISYRKFVFPIIKLIFFNLMYLPILLYFPKLLLPTLMLGKKFWILILAGQVGWLIYDKAYIYFQAVIWAKYRGKIALLK